VTGCLDRSGGGGDDADDWILLSTWLEWSQVEKKDNQAEMRLLEKTKPAKKKREGRTLRNRQTMGLNPDLG
jgi:hypothetical protein